VIGPPLGAAKRKASAAEQGHVIFQSNRDFMYDRGQLVPHNRVQAHMWSNFAASHGYKSAVKIRNIVAEKRLQSRLPKR
jgi:TPR repeat protein